MSEIIKEMGLRLFKEPEAAASLPAVETAILLASAAWNAALGDHGLRDQHREMLKKFDWGGRQPWPELVSTDTDCLIAGLIEYKQARHPDDRRRIVAAETSSDGNVRVHWVEEDKLVAATFGSRTSNATAAIAKSGYPIAEKLVARMKREVRGKVVNLKSAIAGRAAAEELQRTVVTKEGLAAFHPVHAAYVYAQNQVSVMSEQLTALEEMAPFADIVSKAEDLYMPSGPPMSPLTMSYFTCWAFFDACVESTNETIGTTILEVGAAFGMHTELLRLIRLMQESRMGLYAHEGAEGDLIILRELATAAMCHAIVPSGYRGQRGELWYARVLPPPIPGGSEHVVFTTPYVLLEPGIHEWQAYFRRTLPDAPKQARIDANERHMKYGPTRTYWNDFVFEGYLNYRTEAIYLAGLPDVPESRPHSQVNSRRFRR
ncbi:MAG: hypothetical protein Q8Q58_03840 [Candidatus Rokubacteria bacterium]|nr:hypothetical protein [Candidatus Rokubacteria bacterium]